MDSIGSKARPAWWRPLFAIGTGCIVAIACDEATEPTIRRADLGAEQLDAQCEYFVRCHFFPDRETCIASVRPDRGLVQAVGATSFARVRYDSKRAAEWIEALRGLSCDATIQNARTIAEARAAVFVGQIPDGEACFTDEECEGQSVCDRAQCPVSQLCCTGECKVWRELGVGEVCPLPQPDVRLTAVCEDSAYCQAPPQEPEAEPPTQGVCVARVDNGLPCDAIDACFDGQRCNIGGSGNCYKLSASGQMCNPELGQGSCLAINEVCAASSSTCVAAPGPGEACAQGQCAPHAVCIEQMCVARPRLADACDGSIACLGDLECNEGICELPGTSVVCVQGEPPPPPM